MSRRRVKKSPWNTWESGNYEQPSAELVREVVETSGISQVRMAGLLGVDERHFRRYLEPGNTPIPYATWQLLLYHCNYDIGKRAAVEVN